MTTFDAATLRARRTQLRDDLYAVAESLPSDEVLLLIESNQIEGEEIFIQALAGPLLAWLGLREYAVRGVRLTEGMLKQAHRDLMHERLSPEDTGRYRTSGVGIYRGIKLTYRCAPWWQLRALMRCWLRDFNTPHMDRKRLHQRYLDIHPHADGNGRMARLLWAYDLLRRGQAVYPVLRDYGHYVGFSEPAPKGTKNDFHGARRRYYCTLAKGSCRWPRPHYLYHRNTYANEKSPRR